MIQIGVTKIYMKDEVQIYLESKINEALYNYTIKIQSKVRRNNMLAKHLIIRKKVLILSSYIRGFIFREKYYFYN